MTLSTLPAAPLVVSPTRPPSTVAQGWLLQHRTGSGLFVVSQAGTLLFRLDTVSGTLFAWDKKAGREIPIRLSDLTGLLPPAKI